MSQHLEGSENLDDFATRLRSTRQNSTGALPSFIPAFPDYGEIEYSGNTLNFEEMIESLREASLGIVRLPVRPIPPAAASAISTTPCTSSTTAMKAFICA